MYIVYVYVYIEIGISSSAFMQCCKFENWHGCKKNLRDH